MNGFLNERYSETRELELQRALKFLSDYCSTQVEWLEQVEKITSIESLNEFALKDYLGNLSRWIDGWEVFQINTKLAVEIKKQILNN